MTWGEWVHTHPDTRVLSIRRDEFASRFTHRYSYVDSRGEELSSDPYLGYDQKVNVYYSYPLGPLRGSTLVLGLRIDGAAKAYPLYLLRRSVSDVVAGHRLRIVPDPWHAFYPNTLIYAGKGR